MLLLHSAALRHQSLRLPESQLQERRFRRHCRMLRLSRRLPAPPLLELLSRLLQRRRLLPPQGFEFPPPSWKTGLKVTAKSTVNYQVHRNTSLWQAPKWCHLAISNKKCMMATIKVVQIMEGASSLNVWGSFCWWYGGRCGCGEELGSGWLLMGSEEEEEGGVELTNHTRSGTNSTRM